MKKRITILGSTGSIGKQTLSVVDDFPDHFHIVALSSYTKINCLKQQIERYQPEFVAIHSKQDAKNLNLFIKEKKYKTIVLDGKKGLSEIASYPCDLTIVALTGTSGLQPTYNAIKSGNPIALSCKEVLVSAGSFIMKLAKTMKVPIIPVDSEHVAIQQCLARTQQSIHDVKNIVLTASGGPFLHRSPKTMDTVTPELALKHPKWSMGPKISIDSATLMNKGLEVIEAHHLFSIPFDRISVIIHPESIVHGLVNFIDGSSIAQLSITNMKLSIQYALFFPKIQHQKLNTLDLTDVQQLNFLKPDIQTFPLLNLAIECGKKGGYYPAILNVANEMAVERFLNKTLSFTDIYSFIISMLKKTPTSPPTSINDILSIETELKETTPSF